MPFPKNKTFTAPINHKNLISQPSQEESKPSLNLEQLGWSKEEIRASYYRLKPLEEDWNRSEMDIYDDL